MALKRWLSNKEYFGIRLEDLSWIPITHIWGLTVTCNSVNRIINALSGLLYFSAHVHGHTCAYTHINRKVKSIVL